MDQLFSVLVTLGKIGFGALAMLFVLGLAAAILKLIGRTILRLLYVVTTTPKYRREQKAWLESALKQRRQSHGKPTTPKNVHDPKPPTTADPPGEVTAEATIARLDAELKEHKDRLRQCQEKGKLALQHRDQALQEIALLKAAAGTNPPTKSGEKFAAAKRAFARLYHPDNIKADGLDKLVRTEIFKEFWKELEAIEKGA